MRLIPRETQYRIIEKLGEGLNSNVFRALRTIANSDWEEEVALKVLKSERPDELWKRELMSLQRVNHPNCVRYLGFEVFNKGPAIVLELVDGISLQRLRAAVNLSDSEAEEICSQVICGLQALRDNDLCHGDLNLENILIDRKGRVRLIDYGLANFCAHQRYFSKRWAAPEVQDGEQQSYTSDLYSLGAICENLILETKNESYVSRGPFERLLHPNPQDREVLLIEKSNGDIQKKLARKVNMALRLSGTEDKTQCFDQSTKVAGGPQFTWWSVLASALLSILMLTTSGASSQVVSSARLSVRTSYWLKYKIDGGPWKQTPQNSEVLSSGQHEIRWNGARGRGQSSLTVGQGQHIFINNSFFQKVTPGGID